MLWKRHTSNAWHTENCRSFRVAEVCRLSRYFVWYMICLLVIYSLYFMCKGIHTHVERWHGGPQQGLRVGINWRDLIVGILHLWPGQEITKEYSKTYSPQNASWSIPMNVLDPEREDSLMRFRCNLIQVFGTHETDASFQKKVFWTSHMGQCRFAPKKTMWLQMLWCWCKSWWSQ